MMDLPGEHGTLLGTYHGDWPSLCSAATELLNKVAAILLIDATGCGLSIRPVLEDTFEGDMDSLRSRLASMTSFQDDDHLAFHFRASLREVGAVGSALRQRIAGDPQTYRHRLRLAALHLETISAAAGRGPIFDITQCCGGSHGPVVVH